MSDLSASTKSISFRQIDEVQTGLPGIIPSIGRATALLLQKGNTDTAMIYQMSVSLMHAAGSVLFGGIYDLVGLALDLLIDSDIFFLPASRLRTAGEDKNQFDMRITVFELKDR